MNAACARCGAATQTGERFCWRCGLVLSPGPATQPWGPPSPAPVESPTSAPAGWWLRAVSLTIDLLVVSVPAFIALGVAAASMTPSRPSVLHPANRELSGGVVAAVMIGWFVLAALYFTILNSRFTAQTLGNLAVGIAVRDEGGRRRIGLGRSLLRFLLRTLFYVVFLLPGVFSDLMALWTRRRQTLVDLIVRTVVVRA